MKLEYKKLELENGFVALLKKFPGNLTVETHVKAGGAHEDPKKKGVAHLMEHCILGGGGGKKYSQQELDRITSSFVYKNAFTDYTKTTFLADSFSEDMEKILSVTSDVLLHPKFDEKMVNQERGRVIGEKRNSENDQRLKENLILLSTLFKGPAGQDLLGSMDFVSRAGPKDLFDFHSKWYKPSNMVLVAVGDLPKNTESLIKKYFSKEPSGKVIGPEFKPEEQNTKKLVKEVRLPGYSAAKISIAFKTGHGFPKIEDNVELNILELILSNPSDGLFKKLSREMGLTYGVFGYFRNIMKNGYFVISTMADLKPETVGKVRETILEELERVKKGITKEELSNAKKKIKYSVKEAMAARTSIPQLIVGKHFHGIEPEAVLKYIEKVDTGLVSEAARKYFDPEKRTEIVIQPENNQK